MERDPAWPRDSIWTRPESAGVGRPAEHSRAELTAAAIAVAEEHGFAAVTMRRVAARLGTGAASLYRYVANRGELVELMIEAGYAGMELCRTGMGWHADLVEVGREGYRVSTRHQWFVDAMMKHPTAGGPNTVRLAEHCLAVLAEHPAPGHRKMEAIGVMGGMVQLYAGFVTRQNVPELMAAQAAFMLRAAQDGAHPHIAAVFAEPPPADSVGIEDPEDTLARVLGMVFTGMLGPADQAPGSGP